MAKKGNQTDTKLLMREDLQVEVEEGEWDSSLHGFGNKSGAG